MGTPNDPISMFLDQFPGIDPYWSLWFPSGLVVSYWSVVSYYIWKAQGPSGPYWYLLSLGITFDDMPFQRPRLALLLQGCLRQEEMRRGKVR